MILWALKRRPPTQAAKGSNKWSICIRPVPTFRELEFHIKWVLLIILVVVLHVDKRFIYKTDKLYIDLNTDVRLGSIKIVSERHIIGMYWVDIHFSSEELQFDLELHLELKNTN